MKAINKLEQPKPTLIERRVTFNETQQSEYLMELRRWRRDRDQARINAMHEYALRFRQVVEKCEAETGESFSQVFEVYRISRGRWTLIRRKFYRIMRDDGMSFPDMAKLCGVAHSSIMGALLAPSMEDTVH